MFVRCRSPLANLDQGLLRGEPWQVILLFAGCVPQHHVSAVYKLLLEYTGSFVLIVFVTLIWHKFRVWISAMLLLSLRRNKVLLEFFCLQRRCNLWNATNRCGKVVRQLSLDFTLAHATLKALSILKIVKYLRVGFHILLSTCWRWIVMTLSCTLASLRLKIDLNPFSVSQSGFLSIRWFSKFFLNYRVLRFRRVSWINLVLVRANWLSGLFGISNLRAIMDAVVFACFVITTQTLRHSLSPLVS